MNKNQVQVSYCRGVELPTSGYGSTLGISDNADYNDLLRYVELVQPQRVLTVHGFSAEFARDLRSRRIEAWALDDRNQLEFGF